MRDDESIGRTYRSIPKWWLDIAVRNGAWPTFGFTLAQAIGSTAVVSGLTTGLEDSGSVSDRQTELHQRNDGAKNILGPHYAHHPWRPARYWKDDHCARTCPPARRSSCAYRFYRGSDFGFRGTQFPNQRCRLSCGLRSRRGQSPYRQNSDCRLSESYSALPRCVGRSREPCAGICR